MKKMIILALVLVASASLSPVGAAKKKKAAVKQASVQLLTGSDSLSYAAGYVLANILRDRFLSGLVKEIEGSGDSLQYELAYQGLYDNLKNDTTIFNYKPAEKYLNDRIAAIHKAKDEKLKAAGKTFLEENAKKEGVIVLPSGLQYKVLTEGNGEVPKATDKIQVKYEGRLIDGTVFDSTEKHVGKPATFIPNQVIKGWTEALCMMPVGSKWELYIPQELGYGGRATGSIPAFSTLIFDVEVLGIEK